MNSPRNIKDVKAVTQKLLHFCAASGWAGHDPYDAINSPVFTALPLLNSRLPRLILTQVLKRSPVDFRSLLRVPKKQNSKTLGLCLAALVRLSRVGLTDEERLFDYMIESLAALRSPGNSHFCWGYSFPWQTRTTLVPEGTPNLVCTCFVANALLDVHEARHDSRCLDMAVSAAEYLLSDLYWTAGGTIAGFSYPHPQIREQNQIHNANLLAAALLCRVAACTGEKRLLAPALRVARYTSSRQNSNGSWFYGEAATQKWVDNFHTGYNLCALQSISRFASTSEFSPTLMKGFHFYRTNFFREDGAAKYFADGTYPIDIHSAAQSIITLLAFRDLDGHCSFLANQVLRWTLDHMWDERGFFYYQAHRCFTNRIVYMRWSQAWMLLALSSLLAESAEQTGESLTRSAVAVA